MIVTETSAADRPAIGTIDLTCRSGGLTTGDSVSRSAQSTEIFGLIEPHGACKSTAIETLATQLPPPPSVPARIAGFDLCSQAIQLRRRGGHVPQLLCAGNGLSVHEDLLCSARPYRVSQIEREPCIDEVLEPMDLTDVRDRSARQYSGGIIRRLETAQSTLRWSEVTFLDEPTEGLGPVARYAGWRHIRALRQGLGAAVFVTTPYGSKADARRHPIALIDRRGVLAIHTPAAITGRTPE